LVIKNSLVDEAEKNLKDNIPMSGISRKKRGKPPRRVLEESISCEYTSNNYWQPMLSYNIETLEQDYDF